MGARTKTVLFWILIYCFFISICAGIPPSTHDLHTNIKRATSIAIDFDENLKTNKLILLRTFSASSDLLKELGGPVGQIVSAVAKTGLKQIADNEVINSYNSLKSSFKNNFAHLSSSIESNKKNVKLFLTQFEYLNSGQTSLKWIHENMMEYLENPAQKRVFTDSCTNFNKYEFQKIATAFLTAVCSFSDVDERSIPPFALETLRIVIRHSNDDYSESDLIDYRQAKHSFIDHIKHFQSSQAAKIVNHFAQDFHHRQNYQVKSITQRLASPYLNPPESCLMFNLLHDNNYDREVMEKVAKVFMLQLFQLKVINSACATLLQDKEYLNANEKKLQKMELALQRSINGTLGHYWRSGLKNVIDHNYHAFQVNGKINPSSYTLIANSLKLKMLNHGLMDFVYQVVVFEAEPNHPFFESNCDEFADCQIIETLGTRFLVKRYKNSHNPDILPENLHNNELWINSCEEPIEKVLKDHSAPRQALDTFMFYLGTSKTKQCKFPGTFEVFLFLYHQNSITKAPKVNTGVGRLLIPGDLEIFRATTATKSAIPLLTHNCEYMVIFIA